MKAQLKNIDKKTMSRCAQACKKVSRYFASNFSEDPIIVVQRPVKRVRRNVSSVCKRIVAANQHWKCKHCNSLLPACYEVDHKLALCDGGTNEIQNLVALCRQCHGHKTLQETWARSPYFHNAIPN